MQGGKNQEESKKGTLAQVTQMKNRNMVYLNSNISVTTLNLNRLV